jgi:putative transposase
MPAKNVLKYYKKNSYYHIYNRGVAKNKIFLNDKDYKVFLSYLKIYLSPIELQGPSLKVSPSRALKNYSESVELVAYCLMPNHFHLLIYQNAQYAMRDFMRSLATKYAIYFNRKSDRVGPVFQSRYKAVRIFDEDQLIYLSKYIHHNPIDLLPARTDLVGYEYSSYGNYLGRLKQKWLKPGKVLSHFNRSNKMLSYKGFVEELENGYKMIKDKLID